MEKLTPVKFSQVKDISGTKNGKAYSFHSIGFTTREYGDQKWYNLAFNNECPIKEGQTYDFEVTPRQYTGADGTLKTAYNVKLPSELDKLLMRHESDIADLKKRLLALEKAVYPAEERQ